jgi:hypothetical protein
MLFPQGEAPYFSHVKLHIFIIWIGTRPPVSFLTHHNHANIPHPLSSSFNCDRELGKCKSVVLNISRESCFGVNICNQQGYNFVWKRYCFLLTADEAKSAHVPASSCPNKICTSLHSAPSLLMQSPWFLLKSERIPTNCKWFSGECSLYPIKQKLVHGRDYLEDAVLRFCVR